MLEIKIDLEDQITVLSLRGRLDGWGANRLEAEIGNMERIPSGIILECSKLDYLASAGLRIWLKLAKAAARDSSRLIIAGLPPHLIRILEMTGLSTHFLLRDHLDEAQAELLNSRQQIREYVVNGREYQLTHIPTAKSTLWLWCNFSSREFTDKTEPACRASLADLEIAIGTGSQVQSDQHDPDAAGTCLTLGNIFCNINRDDPALADYLQVDDPSGVTLLLQEAISWSGTPSLFCQSDSEQIATLEEIISDLTPEILPRMKTRIPLAGFMLTCDPAGADNKTGGKTEFAGSRLLVAGWLVPAELNGQELLFRHPNLADEIRKYNKCKDFYWRGLYLAARKIPDLPADPDSGAYFRKLDLGLEPVSLGEMDTTLKLSNIRLWLFLPESYQTGASRALKINLPAGLNIPVAWEKIIREIYSGCSQADLTELHGGFTSRTFLANSYDPDGRRLLPTVLKIAQKEITERETEAYRRFVKPFILNNSTSLMGSAAAGAWAGLSYSFVGINGPESKLRWFRDIYLEKPVEDSLPILERVFREVLKPWYGQPKWEKVHLYKDHDPQRMFPDIIATAHREMGIDADQEIIFCTYLQEDLPNPLYFLKHVYPNRLREEKLWYTAVTHGDLNLQNILLDERENIYIIDFSETGYRNITADFARLEPILKIELTRIVTEQDVRDLLIFEKKLLEARSLQKQPENAYTGSDPLVEKAYKFICKLREYANQVTIFEDDIKPYLLAMLEWTLPVICYVNVAAPGKEFALYSSALICQRLLEKD